jgi:alkylhydroperoxidase family enzyme
VPRIPFHDENDPAIAALVETIRARRGGQLLDLDRMLIHSPPYAQGWNTLLGAVRRSLDLDAQLRELAICTVARLNDARYEWRQHAPEYLAAGGTQEKLDALDDVASAARDTRFDALERATLALSLEMTLNVQVSDGTMAEVRRLLGDRQAVELVGTIAAYNMVSRFLEALGISETAR